MNKQNLMLLIVFAWTCVSAVSCVPPQKPTVKKPPISGKMIFEGEPPFEFANLEVLEKVDTKGSLPFLVKQDGSKMETRCYSEDSDHPVWQTKNPKVTEILKKHDTQIAQALLTWSKENILPEGAADAIAEKLTIELELPSISHVEMGKLRLAKGQECIDPVSGNLLQGSKTVTTLFGAKQLQYKVSAPLKSVVVAKIKRKARQLGMHLKPILFKYEKLKDDDGNPIKDKRGRVLYAGPKGEELIGRKIPSPKKQPSVGWTLTAEDPLFFAFGDLPPTSMWAREFAPQTCSINLVFDDVAPRAPDCEELAMVGFGVERTESGEEVLVKVAAKGGTTRQILPLGQKAVIQVAGQFVVWVESKPIVEGAQLTIDSIILAPQNVGKEPPSAFQAEAPPPSKGKRKGKRKDNKKKRRGKSRKKS